jgi:hypothetical protein
MTKREKAHWQTEQNLKRDGWTIDMTAHPNHGSESLTHWMLKCTVAKVLTDRGLRWTMEATHDSRGAEVDVLCHGPEDGAPYAIECEQHATEETVSAKLQKYVHDDENIRECFILPVEDCPGGFEGAYAWVEDQLF